MDKKARDRTCQFIREQYPEREPGSWMTQILDLCAALDAAEEQARALESRAVAAEFRLHFGGQDPTYAVPVIPGLSDWLDAVGVPRSAERREAVAPTKGRDEGMPPWLPYSHRTQGSGFFLRLRPDFAFDVRYGVNGAPDGPLSADYVASEFVREWGKSAAAREPARSEPVACALGDACCERANGFRDELVRVLSEVGLDTADPIDLMSGIAPLVKRRIAKLNARIKEAWSARDLLSARLDEVAVRKTWVPGARVQWVEPSHADTGERLCCKERDELRAELARVADALGSANVDLKTGVAPLVKRRVADLNDRIDDFERQHAKVCSNRDLFMNRLGEEERAHSAAKRLIRDLADAARRMGIT